MLLIFHRSLCRCLEFQIEKQEVQLHWKTCAQPARYQNIHLKWKDTNVSGERVNRATLPSLWFNINVNWNRFKCNEPVPRWILVPSITAYLAIRMLAISYFWMMNLRGNAPKLFKILWVVKFIQIMCISRK